MLKHRHTQTNTHIHTNTRTYTHTKGGVTDPTDPVLARPLFSNLVINIHYYIHDLVHAHKHYMRDGAISNE